MEVLAFFATTARSDEADPGGESRLQEKAKTEDLRNRTPSGMLSSSYKNWDRSLLEDIFGKIFETLDLFIAELGHRDQLGNLKTELAQIAPCTGCVSCIDFDQREGSDCMCGCSIENHKTLSINQHFQRGAPGSAILKTIADNLYPQLGRSKYNPEKQCWVLKASLEPEQACSKCGCGDFVTALNQSKCACGHLRDAHNKDFDDCHARVVDTYLSIIGDRIYTEMKHVGPSHFAKTSMFWIRPGRGTGCGDFGWHRWGTFARNDRNYTYCRCDWKCLRHDQSLAEQLWII